MRFILKTLMVLSVLVLIVAAFYLVPPHLQVRSVEPAIPTVGDLRALMVVENGPVSVRYINTSDQKLTDGTLVHSVFLVEWANGNLFMIDAGMDVAAAGEFSAFLESATGAEPATIRGIISELMADDIERVTGIGFTHLHIDHTQGVLNFCEARGTGATVYQTLSQRDLQNFNTEDGAAIIGGSCLAGYTLAAEGVQMVDEFPGLGIFGVGGHTPGSTMYAIATPEQLWVLSGDTTNNKADINSNTGKGFIYSVVLVPEHTKRTEALRGWLKNLADDPDITVVVSHDLSDIQGSGIAQYGK